MEHCISCWKKEQKDRAFRNYISEVLRLAGENVAGMVHGSYITTQWKDIEEAQPQDDRTGDEIAMDIIKRAGLTFGGEAE